MEVNGLAWDPQPQPGSESSRALAFRRFSAHYCPAGKGPSLLHGPAGSHPDRMHGVGRGPDIDLNAAVWTGFPQELGGALLALISSVWFPAGVNTGPLGIDEI